MACSTFSPLKNLGIALGLLGLAVCGVEFALHLYDACAANAAVELERRTWVPSWTVHHSLRPDCHFTNAGADDNPPVEWQTNSLGLRGPELEIPKPGDSFRILCLGNESTLSSETADDDTFCARLQDMLGALTSRRVEVINAGCPQYGPLLEFLALKHSLLGLAPDVVIVNFDMADIAYDHRCRRSVRMKGSEPSYCPHPDLERQRTAAEKMWVERLQMWRHGRRGLGYLLGNEPQTDDAADIDSPRGTYAWLRNDSPDWSPYIEQTLEVLKEMDALCRRMRCEFVLAVVPCPWQISAEASDAPGVRAAAGLEPHVRYGSRTPFQTLSAFSRKNGIWFCDASVIFSSVKGPERLFLKSSPRFSAPGHELYARVLGRYLVQNLPGPWESGAKKTRPPARLTSAERAAGTGQNVLDRAELSRWAGEPDAAKGEGTPSPSLHARPQSATMEQRSQSQDASVPEAP